MAIRGSTLPIILAFRENDSMEEIFAIKAGSNNVEIKSEAETIDSDNSNGVSINYYIYSIHIYLLIQHH